MLMESEKQYKEKVLYDGCTIVKILRDNYGLIWGGNYKLNKVFSHFEFCN